jgi:hypothetical protein
VDDEHWGHEQERRRGAELADLRHHWSSAYAITYDRGQWIAARNDTGEALTASSAEELLGKIREDYRARPVPRDS